MSQGRMTSGNNSLVTEFILLGVTQQPEFQLPLFLLFLGIYVISVVGNLGLLILIVLNPHLQTPMYYFLFNLSFVDLCYSSVIIPQMLPSFVKQNIISYAECMAQLFFFCFFVIDECYILTAMAYDRYVAICKPLLYKVIMSPHVCLMMMVGVYVMGFVDAMAHVGSMLRLTFCDGNVINHYMCDIPPLLKLSCTSTTINELVIFIVGGVNVLVASLTVFTSYTLILSNICIHSREGRSKAFSTCSSHIIAISLFFGAPSFMYFKPSGGSQDEDKVATVFYTIMGPMLNPFIYSLRNKDVHIALRKTLKKRLFAMTIMMSGNDSLVTEFILAGLTNHPALQRPLFYMFLMVYIVTVVGNLGLITLIVLNSHLHTPMYYFLFNLSFIDLCYSSVFSPKMLMNFVSKKNVISYVGCMTQLFFFLFFVISECYMLTSMAYDRYGAICNPLLYKVTMSHQVCSVLSLSSYVMGFAGAMAHTGCMLRLTFCHADVINHYLCDILPLLQLSCSSTYINEVVVLIVVSINIMVPSLTILISYVFIISNILHIRTTQGRSKAFSTCSSHIIAILVFFGSGALMYLKYSSGSMDQGKIFSVFYTNVVPMFNPLIYSLRNKDVKIALRNILMKIQKRSIF
ncbi:olfactory receptor 8B3-like [Thomomys bottae]